MLNKVIKKVLVLSLPFDVRRRDHVIQHFATLGITQYEFVDAISHRSPLVRDMFLSGRVKTYPTCFRCNLDNCNCENNAIIPQQVANWLSFKKVWEQAANADGPVLVCEDDVYFYPKGIGLLDKWLDNALVSGEEFPELIRLAHSGMPTDVSLHSIESLSASDNIVMSNAAHIITPKLAREMVTMFNRIETTSDIWVHRVVPKQAGIKAITLEPLIATELSFNKEYAKFPSNIHPKGIDEEDEKRKLEHRKRFTSSEGYNNWLGAFLKI